MKISLRGLIVTAMVIAGALLAMSAYNDIRRDHQRMAQLQEEINQLERSLMITNPRRIEILHHELEEFASVQSIRDQAVQHAQLIREKYSHVDARGPDTFSFRSVPSGLAKTGMHSFEFRLIVPENRQIWLKLAVHTVDDQVASEESFDRKTNFLKVSSLTDSGPFQIQLPPGEHLLAICEQTSQDRWTVISLNLGERKLFESKYYQSQSGISSSSNSATEQLDFAPDATLPWLLTSYFPLDPTNSPTQTTTAYSVWLSNTQSEFGVPEGRTR